MNDDSQLSPKKVGHENVGLVIFMDALGTKGSWLRADPENVIEAFTNLSNELEISERTVKSMWSQEKEKVAIKSFIFSDSIIITLDSYNYNILRKLYFLISQILLTGLNRGMCLRGSVSYGTYFTHRDMNHPFVIGPAVDEAAAWYEAANWFGVYTAPTANFLIDKYDHSDPVNPYYFLKYNVPMNDGTVYSSWIINWPTVILYFKKYLQKTSDPIPDLTVTQKADEIASNKGWIYERLSKIPVGPKDITKLSNTMEFYDYVCNNFVRINDEQMKRKKRTENK